MRPMPRVCGVAAALGTAMAALAGCATRSSPTAPASSPHSSSGAAPSASPVGRPAADPAAFAGQGRLAFVWGGDLYVLDGTTKSLRRIETREATSPTWSADGRWLAFLGAPASAQTGEAKQAWIVEGDGTRPAPVPGLPRYATGIAWSPAGTRLAALASRSPRGSPRLWVGTPATPGRPAKQISDEDVLSFAWRPDGQALAYASTPPFGPDKPGTDTLHVVPADGGPSSTEATAPGDGIMVAGWWPDGHGILWWRDVQHSASLAADGLELLSQATGSHDARRLATTLTYRDWISWAPSGDRALLVAGGGRMLSETKALQICNAAAASCTTIPGQSPVAHQGRSGAQDVAAAGSVSVDPAWSPAGDRMAFVRAAEAPGGPTDWASWAQTRTLWVASADGSGARAVPSAGRAVFSPLWDRQGMRLLSLGNGGLELVDPDGAATTIIRRFPAPDGDLLQPETGFYYGHLPVQDLVAWWRD